MTEKKTKNDLIFIFKNTLLYICTHLYDNRMTNIVLIIDKMTI